MDLKEFLLNELYSISNELVEGEVLEEIPHINVAEYRSFKMPDDPSGLLFVIRYITGNYVGNIKTQPVQLFCYCQLNDMQVGYTILDEFSKKFNNYQTVVDGEWVKLSFDTPVAMRNFVQSEIGYRASVYAFGTLIISEDVSDFSKIEYKIGTNDYQEVRFLTATIAYAGVLNTTKISGQQLSKSIKQEAGLTMTLNMMKSTDSFCSDIEDIMFGSKSGNSDFDFKLTKTSDPTNPITVTMKLDSATNPFSKTAAPSYTLVFRR